MTGQTPSITKGTFTVNLIKTIDTLITQNIYPQHYPQKQWMNIYTDEQTRILYN